MDASTLRPAASSDTLTRSGDAGAMGWFVHPCGPNMEVTSGDQLAGLRAMSASEVVISEPVITGTPGFVWVGVAVAVAVLAGVWLMRRTRPMRPAAG